MPSLIEKVLDKAKIKVLTTNFIDEKVRIHLIILLSKLGNSFDTAKKGTF